MFSVFPKYLSVLILYPNISLNVLELGRFQSVIHVVTFLLNFHRWQIVTRIPRLTLGWAIYNFGDGGLSLLGVSFRYRWRALLSFYSSSSSSSHSLSVFCFFSLHRNAVVLQETANVVSHIYSAPWNTKKYVCIVVLLSLVVALNSLSSSTQFYSFLRSSVFFPALMFYDTVVDGFYKNGFHGLIDWIDWWLVWLISCIYWFCHWWEIDCFAHWTMKYLIDLLSFFFCLSIYLFLCFYSSID